MVIIIFEFIVKSEIYFLVKNMQHPNEKVHTEIYESLYDALVESTNKLIEDKVPSTGSMESKVQEKETGNENTDPHSLAINVAPEEGGTDSITFYNMNLPVDKANCNPIVFDLQICLIFTFSY